MAERIRTLGHYVPATMQDFLQLTHLSEVLKKNSNSTSSFIQELLSDHESIASNLKIVINQIDDKTDDFGSSDMVNDLIDQHEKTAWFLRAHLK